MYEDNDDFCGTCGQRFELERRSFPASTLDMYEAHCACTQKAKEGLQSGDPVAALRKFRPPTIGDLLRSKAGRGRHQ